MSAKKRLSGKLRAASAFSACTGFPLEGLCDIPTIYCRGNQEAAVDGCMGILSYSDTQITLRTALGKCTICGNALSMSNFMRASLLIRGTIESICFET